MLCDALVVALLTPLVVSALKIRAPRSSLSAVSIVPAGRAIIDGVKRIWPALRRKLSFRHQCRSFSALGSILRCGL